MSGRPYVLKDITPGSNEAAWAELVGRVATERDDALARLRAAEGAAAPTPAELTLAIMAAVGSPHPDDFGINYRDKRGFSPGGLALAILRELDGATPAPPAVRDRIDVDVLAEAIGAYLDRRLGDYRALPEPKNRMYITPSLTPKDAPGIAAEYRRLSGEPVDPAVRAEPQDQIDEDLRTLRRNLPAIVGPGTAELWMAFGRIERALGHGIYAAAVREPVGPEPRAREPLEPVEGDID